MALGPWGKINYIARTRAYETSCFIDSSLVVLILDRAWPVRSGYEITCFCYITGTKIIYSVHIVGTTLFNCDNYIKKGVFGWHQIERVRSPSEQRRFTQHIFNASSNVKSIMLSTPFSFLLIRIDFFLLLDFCVSIRNFKTTNINFVWCVQHYHDYKRKVSFEIAIVFTTLIVS